MTSAGFGLPPIGEPTGHMHGRVATLRDVYPDFFAPAGNIYLSLDDWARFCIDQLRGANGQGALLKPQTYTMMQKAPAGAPVSVGWFVRDSIAGLPGPVFYHEGSDGPGLRSWRSSHDQVRASSPLRTLGRIWGAKRST